MIKICSLVLFVISVSNAANCSDSYIYGNAFQCIWNDEYDQGQLSKDWEYEKPLERGLCTEAQFYSPAQINVFNGNLEITAERIPPKFFTETEWNPSNDSKLYDFAKTCLVQNDQIKKDFASGSITAHASITQFTISNSKEFVVEARYKLPKGSGIFPAFWLWPEDMNLPESRFLEVDIMEYVWPERYTIPTTLHLYKDGIGSEVSSGINILDRVNVFTDNNLNEDTYHTSKLVVNDEYMTWFFDDKVLRSIKIGDVFDKYQVTSLNNHSFRIVLNFAVGSSYNSFAGPSDEFLGSKKFVVDYVRLYSRNINETEKAKIFGQASKELEKVKLFNKKQKMLLLN